MMKGKGSSLGGVSQTGGSSHAGNAGKGCGKLSENGTVTTTALTAGSDTLSGGTGRDVFTATSSTFNAGDSLDGGAGFDVLKLSGAGTFDLNSLGGFSNIEEIQGTGNANQTITLRDGADLHLVVGNGTNVIATGATGNQEIVLGTGSNTVVAAAGTTTVTANGGSNTLTGGAGQLNVHAMYGTTQVTAGSGGSHIDLGFGTTTLVAGSGVDTLDVGHGRGTASVSGFAQGTDKIDVHALHFASYDDLLAAATVTTTEGSTTLAFDLGPTITLAGVSALTSSDFTL